MRVFVTGATGFIGSAILRELAGAGHRVLGLARNDASAAALTRAGVEVQRGDLSDGDSLAAGARACDGVIHTAFVHDFSQYAANVETDRLAVERLCAALAGTGKALVIASGTAMTAFAAAGRSGTEDDAPDAALPRVAAEVLTLAAAAQGVRSSVVRLAPSVHDHDKQGLASTLIALAQEKRVSAHVGDGLNRWPAVHRLDAASLFALALEKGVAGSRYHAVAEEGVRLRDIAEVIGRRLNVPVAALSPQEAAAHFGWLAPLAGLDCPASSSKTQAALGWRPTRSGLLADLEQATQFAS